MSTLYEITDELLELDAQLNESGGELTPEVELLWEIVSDKLLGKIDRISSYAREQQARAKMIQEEEDRLAARRRVHQNKEKSLKALLKLAMERLGKSKLEGSIFTVALQVNGGVAPLTGAGIVDPSLLPPKFHKIVVEPRNDAIRQYCEQFGPLMDGETVVAQVGERGSSVRIR